MRLVFLSTEFPNACDPTKATFNYDLMSALAVKHDVEILSPVPWTDELRARLHSSSVQIPRDCRVDGMRISHPRYYYLPKMMRRYYDRFLWWSVAGAIRKLQSRPRPDCILSYWAHPDGAAAVRLANKLGVPSIVMVGGSDVLLMTREPKRRQCIRRALRQADAVIAVSQDLRNSIRRLGGIAPQAIHVIPRGVDSQLFFAGERRASRDHVGIPANQRALLWVGRMVPVKGLGTMIQALHQIGKSREEIHLYLVGDGPQRKELRSRVQGLGLSDRVHFVGRKKHEELGPWFRAADLTVLPSLSEGIPNVLLESLACGTPFVASRVGGIPEIAGHSAARLVSPENPNELAEGIKSMLERSPDVATENKPKSIEEFSESVADLASQLTELKQSERSAWIPTGAYGWLAKT